MREDLQNSKIHAPPKPAMTLRFLTFLLAASALVPALVAGIFWRGASSLGAVAGMSVGLVTTTYYMAAQAPWFLALTGQQAGPNWGGILPVAGGVFGVAAGLATLLVVSGLDRALSRALGRAAGPGQAA